MRCCSSIVRLVALLLLADPGAVRAQISSNGSPYSAYGFGDLVYAGQAPSTLMGGTGIAYTEPYSLLSANPASYAVARYQNGEGFQRPVFEGAVRGTFMNQRSEEGSVRRSDAEFLGFSIGVPLGKRKSGIGFGLMPLTNVGYSLSETRPLEEGSVTYEYKGSGGLNRVFAGMGGVLWQQKADTLGNMGDRLAFGANFDYIFGSIEQTRKAVYPAGQAYTNTSAFSALVLHAPTGDVGLHFSSQFISRATVKRRIDKRKAHLAEKAAAWRAAHPGEAYPKADHRVREAEAWRFTLGATAALPTVFTATSTDLVLTYFRGSSGVESTVDTVPSNGEVKGTITVPISYGFGFSVHNSRWLFTAETRRRDWTQAKVDLEGYALPAALRASVVYAAGLRFQPGNDGSTFNRTVYRAGVRYTEDYLQVQGTPLNSTSFSAGISLPLNGMQTNSYLHIGAEYGQRGTTDNGLLQERFVQLWVGVSITPWKRERWFQRYQIQ